jgi:hypothetical protein
MKITYRGVEYDYTPPTVETVPTSEVGKYRGVDIRFRAVKKAPVQQPTLDMVYRGVAYSTQPTAPVATPAKAPQGLDEKARGLLLNRHRNVKRRQQAMMGRLATEVGLTVEEATHYWNHIQGKVHPSFWATYDRSGAASS